MDTHAVSQQLGLCCDPEASPALLPLLSHPYLRPVALQAPHTAPHAMADVAFAPAALCDPEPVVVRCHPQGFDFEYHT
jgi:hypothetical protein